jgi:hypothetical protein
MKAQMKTREFKRVADDILIISKPRATLYIDYPLAEKALGVPARQGAIYYWNFRREDSHSLFSISSMYRNPNGNIQLQLACEKEEDADEWYLFVSDLLASTEYAAS